MNPKIVARLILIFIAVLFDILVLPSILGLPPYLFDYGASAISYWMDDFKPIENLVSTIQNPETRKVYLIAQPILYSLVGLILWTNIITRQNSSIEGIGGPKAAGNGQFGTARLLTQSEVESKTTLWKSGTPIENGGVVLGVRESTKDKEKKLVYLETNDTHTNIIGTSRSGKTRMVIMNTIYSLAHSNESMVLNDPKGELYRKTSKYLEGKGYKIVLLDFRNPSRGNRWNPMNLIANAMKEGNESLASESALDMAHTVVHQKKRSGDPIWANGEESVIAALTLAIAEHAPYMEQKHLTSVYNTLIELGQTALDEDGNEYIPLNDFFRSLEPGNIAKGAFGPAALAPDRTRGSFYSGAATSLRLFSDPGIANLTSTQDHNLEDVGKEKTAVFMIVPDEKETRHVLASLYIDQCYQSLVQLAGRNKDRLPIRVNFLLDEFGNMPPINGFDNKITVAAGRGIRYHIVIQALDQLKEKYGEKNGIIKGGTHTWIYLLTKDIATSEEVSKMTGMYTVETDSYSANVQQKSYSHGRSSNLTSRALYTPDEIRRWPYGRSLVLMQRENPVNLALPDYSEWSFSKELIELDDEPIDYSQFVKVPIYIPGMNLDSKEEVEEKEDIQDEAIINVESVHEKKSILDEIDNVEEEIEEIQEETIVNVEPVQEQESILNEIDEVKEEKVIEVIQEQLPDEESLVDVKDIDEVAITIEETNSDKEQSKKNKDESVNIQEELEEIEVNQVSVLDELDEFDIDDYTTFDIDTEEEPFYDQELPRGNENVEKVKS